MPVLTAELFARLPDDLRHRGVPSAWAHMTRPGETIDSFLESAFFDEEESLWLTDVAYGRVFRLNKANDWQIIHHIDGNPHGIRQTADGRLFAVDYRHGLIEFTGADQFRVLTTGASLTHPDHCFLGLSDMTFAPDGMLWFTDSGRSSLSDPVGAVYCWDEGHLRRVLDGIPYPNGICASRDFVYIAVTRANQVWRLSANLPDHGTPMVGTFLSLSGGLGPDGLALNDHGWLAIAQAQAGRVYIVDAFGDLIADVRTPHGLWTTSVAFAPNDPHKIYIIEAQQAAIYTAQLPLNKDQG
ncbi:MAG: SMP-30/gluconolactonase/LRE family protein [Pseudomonadota bacterium]